MEDRPRLIEKAFPLKQASLDSVHEKNVRHGHISTLHIWPARRPLAACRAALIATLLPDPGDPKKRQELCEKIGGKVVEVVKKKKMPSGKVEEQVVEETVGGILHWGRESDPAMDWFREEIKKAYGGRAPKVLDPFAGGGAIPLEAMRLGCEATAIDINPVAWFILKCTLEYPQKLAGQVRPLPRFALESPEFMEQYFKSTGKLTKKQMERNLNAVQMEMFPAPDVDLSWHVRAWGWWVLQQARKELAPFYPTYADYEPVDKKSNVQYEPREPRLVPLNDDGTPNIDALNADFDQQYLHNPQNPRWVGKPAVTYLWARTVKCKNCRATIPLLKTRWLCKKGNKRVLLTVEPNAEGTGVVFGVQKDLPTVGGNAARRREYDKRVGDGTMSRSGAKCPCCPATMTMEDIRAEGRAGRLDRHMTVVIVDGPSGKEYRLPLDGEIERARIDASTAEIVFRDLPAGIPAESINPASTRSISCHEYGLNSYDQLLDSRQKIFVGTVARLIRLTRNSVSKSQDIVWGYAIEAYLACVLGKCLDYGNTLASWYTQNEQITHLFNRFALPMKWDYAETAPLGGASGSWESMLRSVADAVETTLTKLHGQAVPEPTVECNSVLSFKDQKTYDVAVTDPPYYQAVSYADLSDFFYVWLRCIFKNELPCFEESLTPKQGEIVQHVRSDKDRAEERKKYEIWMGDAFRRVHDSLNENGRFSIVFAHKDPLAWGTLVGATIAAGFTVCASWPIQTEMPNRSRGFGFSALSSSIWLVCKKRPETARPGWDNRVLEEMREKISEQLREFWDAGIRGPDFVWAATGPALEAYSKHPVVKKANKPNELMTVSEFLQHVRRMVVDFVVGRVLTHGEGAEAVEGLDDITTYYLLHRNDFGMNEAPSGACIMYAISCGLSDRALADQFDILTSGKKASTSSSEEDEDETSDEDDGGDSSGGGSTVKLQPWGKRTRKSLGLEAPGGRPVPLIDQVHRLMHLWKKGDVVKVDEYLDERGLRNNKLFHQLLQALIELADAGNGERSILESISNHVAARGLKHEDKQMTIATTDDAD